MFTLFRSGVRLIRARRVRSFWHELMVRSTDARILAKENKYVVLCKTHTHTRALKRIHDRISAKMNVDDLHRARVATTTSTRKRFALDDANGH